MPRLDEPVLMVLQRIKHDYLEVVLRPTPGRANRRRVKAGELVLEAFVGPRPPGHVVRHLNDVSDDNRLANLAWGTQAENLADARRNGLMPLGETHGMAILTRGDVVKIRARKAGGETARQIASDFGVSHWTVYSVVAGKNWGHVA